MASTAPLINDDAPFEPPDDVEALPPRSLVFRVAQCTYTCAISAVRAVVPFSAVTRLPGSPPHVIGLMNVRGTIVTVIDLCHELHGVPCDRTLGSVLLVELGPRVAGLGVDGVVDVRVLGEGDEESYAELDVCAIAARTLITPEER